MESGSRWERELHMQYIVHIGLPKTGSTSLQTALFENRETLLRRGVVYPETGLSRSPARKCKHGKLLRVLKRIACREKNGEITNWFERFHAETAGAEICILSNEQFGNLDAFPNPEIITSLLPRERTRVVMYVREPVAYVSSLYQQQVRATRITMSLREFADSYRLPYFAVAERWSRVIGRENVVIRRYDHDCGNWDIVSDFANLNGLELDNAFQNHDYKLNPSIAGNCLFVKRVLNCFLSHAEAISIKVETRGLAYLDRSFRGKIPVSQETVNLIADRSREILEALEIHYGIMVESRKKSVIAPPCPDLGNLRSDFANILAWARDGKGKMAPLLEPLGMADHPFHREEGGKLAPLLERMEGMFDGRNGFEPAVSRKNRTK